MSSVTPFLNLFDYAWKRNFSKKDKFFIKGSTIAETMCNSRCKMLCQLTASLRLRENVISSTKHHHERNEDK